MRNWQALGSTIRIMTSIASPLKAAVLYCQGSEAQSAASSAVAAQVHRMWFDVAVVMMCVAASVPAAVAQSSSFFTTGPTLKAEHIPHGADACIFFTLAVGRRHHMLTGGKHFVECSVSHQASQHRSFEHIEKPLGGLEGGPLRPRRSIVPERLSGN